MLVIPAIDLRGGRCVRLLQGDPDRETMYSEDPVKMALSFQEAGARLIHVVDLDGAFSGSPVNGELVIKIAKSLSIPIEIGGGIRRSEDIGRYIRAGIERIIIGTVLLSDDYMRLMTEYKGCLIAGIDARDSMVATHGWKNVSSVDAMDVIDKAMSLGIGEVIYTDIATDGMLTGPNIPAMKRILERFIGLELIASGGVSSMDDITALRHIGEPGLKGCIVGKAIYDGRVDLSEALSAIGENG